jgi:hypothetical protein
MRARERKLNANEAVFRGFNEGVLDVEQRVAESDEAEFVCECSDPGCEERLRVPLSEYTEVRVDPIHFLAKKGHEVAALERVVRETDDYLLVEKRKGEDTKAARVESASCVADRQGEGRRPAWSEQRHPSCLRRSMRVRRARWGWR